MKTRVSWRGAGLLLALCGMSSLADVTQQDTTGPNYFEFTRTEYVVAEDATNAVITVRFHPGNRGISGAVAFHTFDGTAILNEDYTSITNTLYFSGWAPRSFSVPIIWDDLNEGEQTVYLRLLPGPRTMVGPDAVLRITNVVPPQRLRLERVRPGLVAISWPGNHGGCIVEQSTNPLSGHWTALTNSPASVSGRFYVTNNSSGASTFYRLRKP